MILRTVLLRARLGRKTLDLPGHFVFVTGTASGQLASYRINDATGALSPLMTYAVGQRPAALLATRFGK